ncbi:hypothetical protein DSO57_1013584 [Entomophthora muscae]|uniref:Uncharacterized protein n=1 Tax=Entomophthora muscae TaxID=34485 RepID=A0ACC2S7M1_9FUNG|nr:hypothetical protein DSO57_1013584 [Entomophthora muscae]
MNSFNQTSPLLQNANTFGQQNSGAQDSYTPFGAQSFANQQSSSFAAQNFGNNQYPSFAAQAQGSQQQCNGNQFETPHRNQRSQVDALREVEQRAQQCQDVLYQEHQQSNDYQTARRTGYIVAKNANISRFIIENVRREIHKRQRHSNSPVERQAYHMLKKLLKELARIKFQLIYLSFQRANIQDSFLRENLADKLVGLAQQAQHLTRDIISDIQIQHDDNQIQTPFYSQNYDGQCQENVDNAGQSSQNQASLENL